MCFCFSRRGLQTARKGKLVPSERRKTIKIEAEAVIRFWGLLCYIGSIMLERNQETIFGQLNSGRTLSFHDWTGQRCRLVCCMTVRFLLENGRCG
jgi:hypothetical protein